MDRRLALVALWAVFAAASVGVGFAAAGLVGGPFSDGVAGVSAATDATDIADADLLQQPAAVPTASSPVVTASPPSSSRSSRSPGSEGSPGSAGSAGSASHSPGSTTSPDPVRTDGPARTGSASAPARAAPARTVTRSITTRGGLVSAGCRSGLVQVSGSPAVGWEIKDIDGGARQSARVRFEQRNGDSRVEVEARCGGGAPRFALDDDDGSASGGDDGDDDDSSGDGGDD